MTTFTGKHRRLTIGFFAGNLDNAYITTVWTGMAETARSHEVNLICFEGGNLQSDPTENQIVTSPMSVMYDLATERSVDGLIIIGTLANDLNEELARRFCYSYRALPLVTIGFALPDLPGIVVDNETGMRALMQHLIEVHGYRHIGFIHGASGNHEARQRYEAYIEALSHYGIPLDPALVMPGDFSFASGKAAAALLLEQKKSSSVEAIVAANDGSALGALETFREHGIRIPHDIALVGFDDIEEATSVMPSLTTVRQPMYTLGCRAVETLLRQLDGATVPDQERLSTELVIRESCGCANPIVVHAAAESTTVGQTENLLVQMRQMVNLPAGYTTTDWAERFLDAFRHAVTTSTAPQFLGVLEDIVRPALELAPIQDPWHDVISLMRQAALADAPTPAIRLRVDNLSQQARVVIGKIMQQVQGRRVENDTRQFQKLQTFWHTLSATFDLNQIFAILSQTLPDLSIQSGYIALDENPQIPTAWAKLLFAYDETGQKTFDNVRFQAQQLIPEGVLAQDYPYNLIVEPLWVSDEYIGFIVLRIHPRIAGICRILCTQISNTLHGALLLEQQRKAQAVLALQPVIRQVMAVSGRLGQTADTLMQISAHMTSEVEQTWTPIATMASSSQRINAVVQDVSTTVTRETGNVMTISDAVAEVAGLVTWSVETSQQANMAIQRLAADAHYISEIIVAISGIAKQTKFLALYAAVVAAQAGQYESGFRVVAKEIKTLAQQVSTSVKQIAQNLKVIEGGGQKATQAIQDVVSTIHHIAEFVDVIKTAVTTQTQAAQNIAQTITETAHESADITDTLQEVTQAMHASSAQTAHIRTAAQELFTFADELRQLGEEIQVISQAS